MPDDKRHVTTSDVSAHSYVFHQRVKASQKEKKGLLQADGGAAVVRSVGAIRKARRARERAPYRGGGLGRGRSKVRGHG